MFTTPNSPFKSLVLLAEQDPSEANELCQVLRTLGFQVEWINDGAAVLDSVDEMQPDLVLLRLTNAIQVCRRIRVRLDAGKLPIIILGRTRTDWRSEARETVAAMGQREGADDYIEYPCDGQLLEARIRALLRRAGSAAAIQTLSFHDIEVDLPSRLVIRNGRRVHLGPTAFRLLVFFLIHPRIVHTREHLLNAVWGAEVAVQPHNVNVYIERLRKSINGFDELNLIRTVPGFGYVMDTEQTQFDLK